MEASVIFEYVKQQDDELDLMVGDTITDVIQVDDGWCEGVLRGKKGMFPDNFVQFKTASTAASTTTPKSVKPPPPQNPTPSEPSVITRAAAQKNKSRRAKVTFSYAAENPDELTLQPGEVVEVLGEEEDGWWRGQMSNKIGLFPSNFVELIEEEATPTPAPSEPVRPQEVADGPPPVLPPDKPRPAAPVGGLGLGPRFNPLDVKLKPTAHHPPPPAREKEAVKKPELRKAAPPPPKAAALPPKAAALPPKAAALPPKTAPSKPPPLPPQDTPPSKPPPLPPQETAVERARVLFAYTSEHDDELTIAVGQILEVIDKTDQNGWWKVMLDGKVGLVPDNFVELIPPEPTSAESTPTKKEHRKPPPPPADEPADFGVPATETLDTSAVKDRPHRPIGSVRPPSRSNIPSEEPEPATGAAAGAAEEAPWQRELKKRKKKDPVKPPPPKTPASSDQTEKKPPPPKATTKPPLGEKPKPRPSPPKPAEAIKATKPSPTKPPEASPDPAPSNQAIEELKEAMEKLRQEFSDFKSQIKKDIRKELQTLSEDLDEERKKNASLRIDVDRLKKIQL